MGGRLVWAGVIADTSDVLLPKGGIVRTGAVRLLSARKGTDLVVGLVAVRVRHCWWPAAARTAIDGLPHTSGLDTFGFETSPLGRIKRPASTTDGLRNEQNQSDGT